MSSHWEALLREIWDRLRQHPSESRQFRTYRLSLDLQLDLFAGMRAKDDALCILLPAVIPAEAFFEVGGMRLSAVSDENGPLVVLSLEDRDRADLFGKVCADAIAAASEDNGSLDTFLARLEAWRLFLKDRRTGWSEAETVGLIGELIIYEMLIAEHPNTAGSWASPDNGLHDFICRGHAIEVKTSIGPANHIHISALDQLDDAGLQELNLFHVRLIEVTGGRSLLDAIEAVQERLPVGHRRAFDNALLRRGLMPDDVQARQRPRFQLRDIEGYDVRDGFPRLARSKVPQAIKEASYALDLRSMGGFTTDYIQHIRRFAEGAANG